MNAYFPFLSVHICGYRITVSIAVFQTSGGGSIPPTRSIGPDESQPPQRIQRAVPPEISKRFIDSIPGLEANGYTNESLTAISYYIINDLILKEIEKLVLVLMKIFVCGSQNLADNIGLIQIRIDKAAGHA